jgi:hypothetical protein
MKNKALKIAESLQTIVLTPSQGKTKVLRIFPDPTSAAWAACGIAANQATIP